MIEMEKTPEHYSIVFFENEFTRDPLELDVMVQIRLPDGKIYNRRMTENLERYMGYEESSAFVSANIAYKLLEVIQKDLQSKIAESISEKLKKYRI